MTSPGSPASQPPVAGEPWSSAQHPPSPEPTPPPASSPQADPPPAPSPQADPAAAPLPRLEPAPAFWTPAYAPGQPPHADPAAPFPPPWVPPESPRRRAPAFPRSDLLGAVVVLFAVSLLGLPLGWLWSRLAPPQVSVVQPDGPPVALPPESLHRFDDLALFALLGIAVGVLSAVALWLLRRHRGPLALLGLAVGSLAAGWLAMRLGLYLADGLYADAVRAAAPNAVVSVPPQLESRWALIAQPLAAVLAYGTAVATNGLDDLGRSPSPPPGVSALSDT